MEPAHIQRALTRAGFPTTADGAWGRNSIAAPQGSAGKDGRGKKSSGGGSSSGCPDTNSSGSSSASGSSPA